MTTFIHPGYRAAVEPAYERALICEIAQITTSIPAEDLALQLDLAIEFALIEGAQVRGKDRYILWFDNVIGARLSVQHE